MKPDCSTAMVRLIADVRNAVPFDLSPDDICDGMCNGCSKKLIDYLEIELEGWEQRLKQGEKPGLAELSKLARRSRKIHRVLQKNGLVAD